VRKQQEKGLEHVDFRKKEEEAKLKARNDENKAEREKQRDLRNKRKENREATLGLDILDPDVIQEQRQKVKETLL
jgi:hypothetical protein